MQTKSTNKETSNNNLEVKGHAFKGFQRSYCGEVTPATWNKYEKAFVSEKAVFVPCKECIAILVPMHAAYFETGAYKMIGLIEASKPWYISPRARRLITFGY